MARHTSEEFDEQLTKIGTHSLEHEVYDEPSTPPTTSMYLEYGKNSNDPNSLWHYFLREVGGQSGQCKLCDNGKILKTLGGSTKGLHGHLRGIHKIDLLNKDSVMVESCYNIPANVTGRKHKATEVICTPKRSRRISNCEDFFKLFCRT